MKARKTSRVLWMKERRYEKMKVGVLTYHSANNYGTCLQCYALMHLVEQAGYDCDVIDYRGEKLSNSPVMRKGLAAQVTDLALRNCRRTKRNALSGILSNLIFWRFANRKAQRSFAT